MHYKMYSYANSPQPLNRNIPLSILVFPYQIMNLINRSREWAVWGVLVSEKYPVDMERLISFQFKYRDHDTQVTMNVGVGVPNNSNNIDFHWSVVVEATDEMLKCPAAADCLHSLVSLVTSSPCHCLCQLSYLHFTLPREGLKKIKI